MVLWARKFLEQMILVNILSDTELVQVWEELGVQVAQGGDFSEWPTEWAKVALLSLLTLISPMKNVELDKLVLFVKSQ